MDPALGHLAGRPLTPWNHGSVKRRCPHCLHTTQHPMWKAGMIRFLRENPTSQRALRIASEAAAQASTVLVIEDSDHKYDHVKDNLDAYATFVTPGSYFIVQDTRLWFVPSFPYPSNSLFFLPSETRSSMNALPDRGSRKQGSDYSSP